MAYSEQVPAEKVNYELVAQADEVVKVLEHTTVEEVEFGPGSSVRHVCTGRRGVVTHMLVNADGVASYWVSFGPSDNCECESVELDHFVSSDDEVEYDEVGNEDEDEDEGEYDGEYDSFISSEEE